MIDVIIPAFNAHETVERALLSILNQTIKDEVKVYLVDDFSNKPYDDIISFFNGKLDITLIRLYENKGPGNARNVGLDKSSNPYIIFLDADDEIYNSFTFEHLVNSTNDYDFVFGGIYEENKDGKYNYYMEHEGCLHGKLYKRSIIDKYNIRFTDTSYSEDNYFNQLYISLIDDGHYISEPAYIYNYSSKSLTKDKGEKINYFYNYNMSLLIKKCEDLKVKDKKIIDIILSVLCYNYKEYIVCSCKKKYFINNPKEMIISYFNKYKNKISDNKIKEVLFLYPFDNLEDISFKEYLNLLM